MVDAVVLNAFTTYYITHFQTEIKWISKPEDFKQQQPHQHQIKLKEKPLAVFKKGIQRENAKKKKKPSGKRDKKRPNKLESESMKLRIYSFFSCGYLLWYEKRERKAELSSYSKLQHIANSATNDIWHHNSKRL